MTDLNQSNVQDERSQEDALADLKIADLRRVAKLLRINAQRDWVTEDFVRAIKDKQDQHTAPSLVFDNALAPKPGYARIVIHRDMTPGHKNTPVHAGVNGWIFQIPRGIEVDVPKEIVEALQNARSIVTSQDKDETTGRTETKDSMVQSYPFQVLAISPGKATNPVDNRAASAARRQAFCDKFGRYPTSGELQEAMKHQIARQLND